jgi:hypothetical protein
MCHHCNSGKAISIIYSECVFVVLGIQHAQCMRFILLSSVAKPSKQYSSTCSYERHNFQKERNKKLLNTKCVFRFSIQPV